MKKAFIRNRTEELGHDLWDSYILPPYFNNLGIREAKKSIVLEGGRGCGKTALLRYLSFNSQFSKNRTRLDYGSIALGTIGLYLKADPQYFSGFTGGWLEDRKWLDIFEHALCINLATQLTDVLLTLNCSPERLETFGKLELLAFDKSVGGFSKGNIPSSFSEFRPWIISQKHTLSRWLKNADSEPCPELFPLKDFLEAIISEYKNKLPYFKDTVFTVFVDEYENLLGYQQKLLNTMIKGGEPPLIFHIAMKPNGMQTRMTIGTESIQEIADFRKINLDDQLSNEMDLFAAELFFFRLIRAGVAESDLPVSINRLQSENDIQFRLSDTKYRSNVIKEIQRILPGRSYKDLALDVLSDPPLKARWTDIVSKTLSRKNSTLIAEDFFDIDWSEASVVCAALLNQAKNPNDILDEFNKLRDPSKRSKFKDADWIHHFLLGTLLLIYLPFRQRNCPIYAGFDNFIKLSKTNVRHFLELCHQSVDLMDEKASFDRLEVPIHCQADAAFRVSRNMKEEVSGCGDTGNRLMSIVNLLGKLFRLSQYRLSQSEPERTHFSIIQDEISPDAQKILDEAIKWSVLFKMPESKVKGTRYESSEYLLNPIYAPFFGISYNKGRKLEIPYNKAEMIFTGSVEDFTELLRTYERDWLSDTSDQLQLDL